MTRFSLSNPLTMACRRTGLLLSPPLRVAAFLTVLGWCGCSDRPATTTLKLAHGLDISHPVHQGMRFLGEELARLSDSTLTLAIYPNQQLGTERQCLELLQIGSLAMTKVSGAVMENFAPDFQVLSLPYVFRDRNHLYRALDGETGRQLLLQSERYRLRGLTYFDAGQRSFYSKKPIRTPEDLAGMKIRVQESLTAMQLVQSLGASPTPVSWGELYTALQQGVVDGAENNPPSFHSSRHYEHCRYYTLNEHTAVPDVLVIGTDAWSRLTPQQQGWLQAAADSAKVYQRRLWQEAEQEALAAVAAAGVEIIRPDKSAFAAKTTVLLDAYRSHPTIFPLLRQIRELP